MSRLQSTAYFCRLAVLSLLITLLFSSVSAIASDRGFESRQENRTNKNNSSERGSSGLSQAQAAQLVERRYGGKVMNIQTRNSGNGQIHSVKVLQSSGHMRTYNVNSQTGEIVQ